MRTYSELMEIEDFMGRLNYLLLTNSVGVETFGNDRWMNQRFYNSVIWKRTRLEVIARDYGLDLGHEDNPISGTIVVHHMNPVVVKNFEEDFDCIINKEYLISASINTHKAIHFGCVDRIQAPVLRRPGDTKLW